MITSRENRPRFYRGEPSPKRTLIWKLPRDPKKVEHRTTLMADQWLHLKKWSLSFEAMPTTDELLDELSYGTHPHTEKCRTIMRGKNSVHIVNELFSWACDNWHLKGFENDLKS